MKFCVRSTPDIGGWILKVFSSSRQYFHWAGPVVQTQKGSLGFNVTRVTCWDIGYLARIVSLYTSQTTPMKSGALLIAISRRLSLLKPRDWNSLDSISPKPNCLIRLK